MDRLSYYGYLILYVSVLFAGDPIIIDGQFEDWSDIPIIYSDPENDGILSDFFNLKITYDNDFVFIYVSFHSGEFLFQDWNEFHMYIDADNDNNTGHPIAGIGAELDWCFGERSGYQYFNGQAIELMQNDIILRIGPTITSQEFEIGLSRNSTVLTLNNTHSLEEARIIFVESGGGSDQLPDESGGIYFTIEDDIIPSAFPIPLGKIDEEDIRILSYNTLNEGILDSDRQPHFKRIFQAINPDIIALQEHSDWNQIDDVIQSWFPQDIWHASWTYRDLVILSRFPIIGDASLISSDRTMCALLNTEQELGKSLLIINSHLSCCGNNEDRQEQVDEFAGVWRDWILLGDGSFNLEFGTPFIHLGDFNFVGFKQQVETIRVGDIVDENEFGSDFFPDWDSTSIVDLFSRHTQKRMGFTWQNDNSSYNPGKLDYIFYSDAVLDTGRHYVLNTMVMDEQILDFYGLEAEDTYLASDHLPRVIDVRMRPSLGIKKENIIPMGCKIYNSFPNPFNSSISLKFLSSYPMHVKVSVVDMQGNIIKVLINETKSPGGWHLTWDGLNEKNILASTGLYFILFESDGVIMKAEKVIFLK